VGFGYDNESGNGIGVVFPSDLGCGDSGHTHCVWAILKKEEDGFLCDGVSGFGINKKMVTWTECH